MPDIKPSTTMTSCLFNYCIYNKDDICVLESVEMNARGMCEDCILVMLDKDFLEAKKMCQWIEMSGRLDKPEEETPCP